ncbi:hypothetical protein [Streptomyces sp. NPDC048643]|uniref:hypothetical protein n=1 Tax=Streptomyces sp. NPDC048643 TaxID=3155637 RepID=UPI0034337E9D
MPKVAGKWVKMPAGDDQLTGLCDKQGLLEALDEDKSERKGMSKGGSASVDGTSAVKLTKESDGKTLTMYVASEGKPYILRVTTTGGSAPESTTFSDYNEPGPPATPHRRAPCPHTPRAARTRTAARQRPHVHRARLRLLAVRVTPELATRLHGYTKGHPLYVRTVLAEVPLQVLGDESARRWPVHQSLRAGIGARVEEWFSANGTPATRLDDVAPAFDIGNILASAESFRVSVAGPPPTV